MESITNILENNGGVLSVKDLSNRAEYKRVLRAVDRGELIRVRPGVYAEPTALFSTMVDIERIIPGGVVCLYNAWSYYQLSTIVPPAFCVAVKWKRKITLPDSISIQLYYWKDEYFDIGIVEQEISGHTIRITDLERSVCDAIKYRNKIGMDICAEVVRTYLRRNDRNLSRLYDYAKKLRVYNTLNNLIEITLE